MAQPNYLNGVAEIRTRLEPAGTAPAVQGDGGRSRTGASRQMGLPNHRPRSAAVRRPDHPRERAHRASPGHPFALVRAGGPVPAQSRAGPSAAPGAHARAFAASGRRQFRSGPGASRSLSVSPALSGSARPRWPRSSGEVFRTTVLFEPYDTNPFLPEVYAGKSELALDSQLFFLVHRTQELGRGVLPPGALP